MLHVLRCSPPSDAKSSLAIMHQQCDNKILAPIISLFSVSLDKNFEMNVRHILLFLVKHYFTASSSLVLARQFSDYLNIAKEDAPMVLAAAPRVSLELGSEPKLPAPLHGAWIMCHWLIAHKEAALSALLQYIIGSIGPQSAHLSSFLSGCTRALQNEELGKQYSLAMVALEAIALVNLPLLEHALSSMWDRAKVQPATALDAAYLLAALPESCVTSCFRLHCRLSFYCSVLAGQFYSYV